MLKEFIKMLKTTEQSHNEFIKNAKIGEDYYNNQNLICKTGAAAIAEVNGYLKKLGKSPLRSADNRIPTNWHRIITDQKVGYLFTYPPQFDVEDYTVVQSISDALGGSYPKVLRQLAQDATNYGVGWLAYWYNSGEPFQYWFVDPRQIRVIYDSTCLKPTVKQLIRSYTTVNEKGRNAIHYELWDNQNVYYFVQNENGEINIDTSVNEKGFLKHSYKRIPFIAFKNNDGCIGDINMYRQIIDAIDKLVSGFANDIDDIQEIIWVIKNYAGEFADIDYDKDGKEVPREIDLLQKIKAKKIINVEGDGDVDTLHGEIPHEARKAFLEILNNQLYISAMAVNPFPDAVGQASGVYIDFLYSLLELKAGLMETEFRTSLDEFVKAILAYLNIKDQGVEQIWTRNKPRNDLEVVQMITQTSDTVLSEETKTKAHPLTEQWQEERKRIDTETSNRNKDIVAMMGVGDM